MTMRVVNATLFVRFNALLAVLSQISLPVHQLVSYYIYTFYLKEFPALLHYQFCV
jgi:hypothetical protein